MDRELRMQELQTFLQVTTNSPVSHGNLHCARISLGRTSLSSRAPLESRHLPPGVSLRSSCLLSLEAPLDSVCLVLIFLTKHCFSRSQRSGSSHLFFLTSIFLWKTGWSALMTSSVSSHMTHLKPFLDHCDELKVAWITITFRQIIIFYLWLLYRCTIVCAFVCFGGAQMACHTQESVGDILDFVLSFHL